MKGTYTGKENKTSLFADNMTGYLESPAESIK